MGASAPLRITEGATGPLLICWHSLCSHVLRVLQEHKQHWKAMSGVTFFSVWSFSALQRTSPTVYCISKAEPVGLPTRASSVDHRSPLKSCIFGPRGIAETCLCSTLSSTARGGTHGSLTRAYQGKVAPQGVINLSLHGDRDYKFHSLYWWRSFKLILLLLSRCFYTLVS